MWDLIIGSVVTGSFMILVNYSQRRGLRLSWWKWGLTVLGFLYGLLVLETIATFLEEGAPQAALVMGVLLGIVAAVWGVLLGRFVFTRRAEKKVAHE